MTVIMRPLRNSLGYTIHTWVLIFMNFHIPELGGKLTLQIVLETPVAWLSFVALNLSAATGDTRNGIFTHWYGKDFTKM